MTRQSSEVCSSRRSALGSYTHDLGRHPLMTAAEEHEVAARYVKTRAPALAARLVSANLRLVIKIVLENHGSGGDFLDLIQEGNLGLVHAVEKYDPDRGVRLASYAAWWIRAYVLRFVVANARMVKLGTTQVQRRLFFNLRREKAARASQGLDQDPRRLAAALGASDRDVVAMEQRLAACDRSLDTPLSSQQDGTWDPTPSIDAEPPAPADLQLAALERRAILTHTLQRLRGTLSDRDLVILEERLLNDEPTTFRDLAGRFGISCERVRQLETRIKQGLRRQLETELGTAEGIDDMRC